MAGGPVHANAEGVRAQALQVAVWMESFAAPAYGPFGGHKIVDQSGGPIFLRSAASALREVRLHDAAARPYRALVDGVQGSVGDQATAALLLAARLVRAGLEGRAGGSVAARVDGYVLARRQVLALLGAHAEQRPGAESLGAVAPGLADAAAVVVQGLQELAGHDRRLDLDQVDVRAEPGEARWSQGLVAQPQDAPKAIVPNVGVLLLTSAWTLKPRPELRATVRGPAEQTALRDHEAARRRQVVDRLVGMGIGLVVCAQAIDDQVVDELGRRGVTVWTDAPKTAITRLQAATGAVPVPRPEDAAATMLGRADLVPRKKPRQGVMVHGPGPSATLLLPAQNEAWRAAVLDDGERLLRAAGAWLTDGRAVPGGGRWQRLAAAGLHKAADLAPGKGPLAVHAAADAVASLADDLVRNAGGDPLRTHLAPGAETIWDPWPSVRVAVDAAFTTAIAVLRLDGRHDKAPSSPQRLRGGLGPAGSPRGMPGDVPPLM